MLLVTTPAAVLALGACTTAADLPAGDGPDATANPGGDAPDGADTDDPSLGPDLIDGRTFVLDSASGDTALVPEERIELSFDAGEIRVSDGCNGLGGQYLIADGRLEVTGDIPRTEIGCPPEYLAQETFLDEAIRSDPQISWDEEELTISSDDADLHFLDRDIALPDRELVDTTWVVEEVITGTGPEASVSPVQGETEVRFEEDGTFSFQLCNSGQGDYSVEGDVIRFTNVISTQMACADSRGDAEDALTAMIDTSDGAEVTIDGDRLSITGPGGGLGLVATGPAPAATAD